MRRPILLLILLCAVVIGCKKKDAAPAEVTLVGKWYIKTLINTGGPNTGTYTGFSAGDNYVFGADNVVNISNSTQGITAIMSYTYVNDKIVISNSDRADTYLVLKLTTDSLVMRNTLSTVQGQPLMSNNTPIYKFARK